MTSYTMDFDEGDDSNETMVDLGGGMIVPLRELIEDDNEDDDENDDESD